MAKTTFWEKVGPKQPFGKRLDQNPFKFIGGVSETDLGSLLRRGPRGT